MAEDLVKLQVSDDLIRNIVGQQVTAAMLTAMGGREEFMQKIVEAALTFKVDSNGNKSQYNDRNDTSWILFTVNKMIHEAARTALKAWVEQNQPAIQRAIHATMTKQSKEMAIAFAAGISKAIESSWQFKVDVMFNSKGDR